MQESEKGGAANGRARKKRADAMEGGHRAYIYLDRAAHEAAYEIGAGNVSAGIRRALEFFLREGKNRADAI